MPSTLKRRRVTLPGHVRVAMALYHAPGRMYSQVPGCSVSRITVRSRGELDRLWRALQDVIEGADWRDARAGRPPVGEEPAGALVDSGT